MSALSRSLSPYMPLILGLLCATGTLRTGYALTDPLIALLAVSVALRGHRPPLWLWLLAGSVAVGALWAPVPWLTLWWAARVLALGILGMWAVRTWAHGDRQLFIWGIVAGLAMQTAALPFVMLESRHWGLSHNAFILGQTGFMLWMLIPHSAGPLRGAVWLSAALTIVTSATRTALGAAGLFVLLTRDRRMALLFVPILLGFVLLHPQRFELHHVLPMWNARVATSTGDTSNEKVWNNSVWGYAEQHGLTYDESAAIVATRKSELTLLGYGTAGYVHKGVPQRPHNIFVLMAYEMGALVLVPVGLLAWALWTRRLPLAAAVSVCAFGFLSDDPVASPYGHYFVAAVMLMYAKPLVQAGRYASQREQPEDRPEYSGPHGSRAKVGLPTHPPVG